MGMGFGMGNVMGNMAGNMNTGNSNQQSNSSSTGPPPPPSKDVQYFVLINNQQNGPHTLDTIKFMIGNNQINQETLVWKQGMANWENIMKQEDLKVLFDQIPPPPPLNS